MMTRCSLDIAPPPDARARLAEARRPVRTAALDVGRARIGVAVSDPGTGMALAHSVLERRGTRRDVAALVEVFARLGIEAVVVGLPPEQDEAGPDAGSAGLARRFAAAVATACACPVWLVDEADTTVEATAELRLLGMRASRRRREIDKHAAARILDRFLGGDPAEPVAPGP